MSYKHLVEAEELEWEFGSFTQRYLFLEAAYNADRKGIVRLSQSEIASLTLCSPRTVAKEFKSLAAGGLLKKLGHGRYQIIQVGKGETPEDNSYKNKLRKWLNRWADAFEIGHITVMHSEEENLPDFVLQALDKGLLKKGERGKVIVGPGKTEDYVDLTIHFRG